MSVSLLETPENKPGIAEISHNYTSQPTLQQTKLTMRHMGDLGHTLTQVKYQLKMRSGTCVLHMDWYCLKMDRTRASSALHAHQRYRAINLDTKDSMKDVHKLHWL